MLFLFYLSWCPLQYQYHTSQNSDNKCCAMFFSNLQMKSFIKNQRFPPQDNDVPSVCHGITNMSVQKAKFKRNV